MDRLPHDLPHTDAVKDEPLWRLEAITPTARRRRWSEQDKARIMAERLRPSVIVTEIARQYRLHRSQLYGSPASFGVRLTP